GDPVPKGALVPGTWYEALRHSGQWKLLTDAPVKFDSAVANDPIPVSIVPDAVGGTSFGMRPDGSWYAPSAFGAFHWPGDDIVMFETAAGQPVLAINPETGALIAHMEI